MKRIFDADNVVTIDFVCEVINYLIYKKDVEPSEIEVWCNDVNFVTKVLVEDVGIPVISKTTNKKGFVKALSYSYSYSYSYIPYSDKINEVEYFFMLEN